MIIQPGKYGLSLISDDDDLQEIIGVNAVDDGTVQFLIQRKDGGQDELTMTFHPKRWGKTGQWSIIQTDTFTAGQLDLGTKEVQPSMN